MARGARSGLRGRSARTGRGGRRGACHPNLCCAGLKGRTFYKQVHKIILVINIK